MPMYLNHRAMLQCTHGGQVILFPPPFRSFNVMQSPALTDMDLLKAMIVGCPQVGIGVKPCTKVVMIIVGRAIQIYVDGETPLLDSLQALTDGIPPGEVTAVTNGESNATPAPHSLQADTLRNAARTGAPFCQVCKPAQPDSIAARAEDFNVVGTEEAAHGVVPVSRTGMLSQQQSSATLDKDKFVNYVDLHAKSSSQGKCAVACREGFEAGGLDATTHPTNAKDYGPFLTQHGASVVSEHNYKPQKGDVAVFQGNDSHPYGHIEVYDGKQWVSDFKQNNFSPYRTDTPPSTVYRFPDDR